LFYAFTSEISGDKDWAKNTGVVSDGSRMIWQDVQQMKPLPGGTLEMSSVGWVELLFVNGDIYKANLFAARCYCSSEFEMSYVRNQLITLFQTQIHITSWEQSFIHQGLLCLYYFFHFGIVRSAAL